MTVIFVLTLFFMFGLMTHHVTGIPLRKIFTSIFGWVNILTYWLGSMCMGFTIAFMVEGYQTFSALPETVPAVTLVGCIFLRFIHPLGRVHLTASHDLPAIAALVCIGIRLTH